MPPTPATCGTGRTAACVHGTVLRPRPCTAVPHRGTPPSARGAAPGHNVPKPATGNWPRHTPPARAARLEVDETGLPVPVQHDVARLEIPVLERVLVRISHQILGHLRKRLFQLHLVKVQSRSLQEAIFKIVQIKENSRPVHGSHRVTPSKIQAFCPDKLDAWQFRYRPPQQFLLFRSVTSAFSRPSDSASNRLRCPKSVCK